MVESMYDALDAECGHDTTDFMKSFLALYQLLRYGHSDYQRSVDEVGSDSCTMCRFIAVKSSWSALPLC